MTTATVKPPISPEDAARADFYALLGALFTRPPDRKLLESLALAAPLEPGTSLAKPWEALVLASGVVDAEAVAEEYEALFVGVGKARVSIYAGFYVGASAVDHPRVRIARAMDDLRIVRAPGVTEPEDHLGGLFEVMRLLIAGAPGRPAESPASQKVFFEQHVGPAAIKFFDAVRSEPDSNYYSRVAGLGSAFVVVESESLQLS